MKEVEKILESYQKADFNKRLNLFLEYRHLRKEFMEIELEEKPKEYLPAMEENIAIIDQLRIIFSSINRKISTSLSLNNKL